MALMPCIEMQAFDPEVLDTLVVIARYSILEKLRSTSAPPRWSPTVHALLRTAGASFVTLKHGAALRGCIGSLEAHHPLHEDVAANAAAAAFSDRRFAPLADHEVVATCVQVAVLSAATELAFASEDDLYARLRPGVDGLIIEHVGRRATYLPSVWEMLAEPRTFVAELRRKAGIEVAVPMTALTVRRYTTTQSAPHALPDDTTR